MSMTMRQGLAWLREATLVTPFPENGPMSERVSATREPYINYIEYNPEDESNTNLLLFHLRGQLWVIPWKGLATDFAPFEPDAAWLDKYLSSSSREWAKQSYNLTMGPWELTNWIKEHR